MRNSSIILFDGVCNLCNASVQFIIERDPKAHFRFAALQSPIGQRLSEQHGLSPQTMETMVLVEGTSIFTKSDAALRIAKRLSGIYPALAILFIIPRPIRNWAYDLIANHRYKWFGKRDSCMVPTDDILDRFLE
ncbi:MAG: thiol-disulfide oxidoreductase DCC family protein [Candidatus Binatia bacterium]